ncbi:MAG: polyphosphate polymerase domain-containing protein [Deltaproteobacteria bacterium]|nr:polyphosphate polymerase domain-containing protein [Deltaproteobacteria bacterium]
MVVLLPASTRQAAMPPPGSRMVFAADATTAQRYEVKFWATEEQSVEMLRMAEPHLEVDPFCKSGPQRNISLYLDSPLRTFFELHLTGVPSRFKLRVRTYDDPQGPAFLEVKRRVKSVTSKLRTAVPRALARELVAGHLDAAAGLPPTRELMEFLFLHQRYMAEPVLLVAARRLALRSTADGGRFRMTLDRDIQYQHHCGTDLTGRPRGWTPVDITVRNGHEALRVLFEMKFVDACPGWLAQAIERLGLRPTSYSKYVAAMAQSLEESDAGGPTMGGRYEDEDGE